MILRLVQRGSVANRSWSVLALASLAMLLGMLLFAWRAIFPPPPLATIRNESAVTLSNVVLSG